MFTMISKNDVHDVSQAGSPSVRPGNHFRLFARSLRVGELRLLAPYDAAALLDLMNSDRDHFEQWLPWARELHTVDDARGFIARGTERYVEFGTPWIGIWLDDVMAGGVLFWPVDDMGEHVELGYWLAGWAGHRGIMTNAVAAIVDYCFDELHLNKVAIRCVPENEASCGIPQRLGFTQEGLLRQQISLDGNRYDLAVYGMLSDDWPGKADR